MIIPALSRDYKIISKEENKMENKTEKEYVIEGITEALSECQDLEILYIIRSLLLKSNE